jgi:hypothetical protein
VSYYIFVMGVDRRFHCVDRVFTILASLRAEAACFVTAADICHHVWERGLSVLPPQQQDIGCAACAWLGIKAHEDDPPVLKDVLVVSGLSEVPPRELIRLERRIYRASAETIRLVRPHAVFREAVSEAMRTPSIRQLLSLIVCLVGGGSALLESCNNARRGRRFRLSAKTLQTWVTRARTILRETSLRWLDAWLLYSDPEGCEAWESASTSSSSGLDDTRRSVSVIHELLTSIELGIWQSQVVRDIRVPAATNHARTGATSRRREFCNMPVPVR